MSTTVDEPVVVTDQDRKLARDAMVEGSQHCKQINVIGSLCDCNLGVIDGCKARVEVIALAIALARAGRR